MLFFVVGLSSGRNLALSATPLAIQLSLKDSSCAVLDCTEGGPVPLHTEEHCYNPGDSEPAVTAPCYTVVGNLRQTSSKAGWETLRGL